MNDLLSPKNDFLDTSEGVDLKQILALGLFLRNPNDNSSLFLNVFEQSV